MRRLAAAAVALLVAAPAVPAATAAPSYAEAYFPSADGTPLHAEIHRPARAGRVPVVLLVSPYNNGTHIQEDRAPRSLRYEPFEDLLARGYAIVQVSLRGYGASGGCGDWGGPGEQADVKAAVEWAAGQQWSTGRVGMWGISYDGWTQVMGLATKPRGLAAVVAQAPVVTAYDIFWTNGAHYEGLWWATPANYTTLDARPPHSAQGTQGLANHATGLATNPHCYAANTALTATGDPSLAFWRERDLLARAAASTVPVLWSHGFRDVAVKPNHFAMLYPRLRGPKRAWVGQFTHRAPDHADVEAVRARYLAEAFEWLDAYVKRDPAALRRVAARPQVVAQQADGRWRGESRWPATDARHAALALRPGTYVEYPTEEGRGQPRDGGVLWSISRPLPYAVHLSGVPRATLTARGTGPAQVAVKVWDVAPDGGARAVTRGIHAGVSGAVSFDLLPQDWRFEKGHRIAIAVQGDELYWGWPYGTPYPATGAQVSVSGATLHLPALAYERRSFLFDARLDVAAPELTLSAEVVKSNETAFRLPPRMKRR